VKPGPLWTRQTDPARTPTARPFPSRARPPPTCSHLIAETRAIAAGLRRGVLRRAVPRDPKAPEPAILIPRARSAPRRQDYDEAQFDALCLCLAPEPAPLERLRDWLIELSIFLIRPAALQLPTDAAADSAGAGLGAGAGGRLLLEERFQYFVNRVAQACTQPLVLS
jgi:hypothetical protein